MLPDRASLWVAGVAPGRDDLAWWDGVFGFSMAPVREALRMERLRHVAVVPVSGEDVITTAAQVQAFDLMAMHARDAAFTAEFRLDAQTEVRRCALCPLSALPDVTGLQCTCVWHVAHPPSPLSAFPPVSLSDSLS